MVPRHHFSKLPEFSLTQNKLLWLFPDLEEFFPDNFYFCFHYSLSYYHWGFYTQVLQVQVEWDFVHRIWRIYWRVMWFTWISKNIKMQQRLKKKEFKQRNWSTKQTKMNPHFPMLWWWSRPLFGKGARAPPPKARRLFPGRNVDLTRESGGNRA